MEKVKKAPGRPKRGKRHPRTTFVQPNEFKRFLNTFKGYFLPGTAVSLTLFFPCFTVFGVRRIYAGINDF
jgi:hypothetical protein